jgi:hypothetical protein
MGSFRRHLSGWSGTVVTGWLLGGCVSGIPFETIDRGVDSGYQHWATLVIRTEEAWREVWERHRVAVTPMPPRPQVDFEQEMVIAVFLGERPTGGFALGIKTVERRAHGLHVLIEEMVPAPHAMVTQAFTSPYHFIRLKRRALPVEFEVRSPLTRL